MRKQCAMSWRRVWMATLLASSALMVALAEDDLWHCEGRLHCERGQQGRCTVGAMTCPENTVRMEGINVCGCCPGCVVPIEADEPCDPDEAPCVDGYSCQTLNATDTFCEEGACTKVKIITESNGSAWKPSCEPDGTFAAVQCKGLRNMDGRCFCWAPDGSRLHGFAEWGPKSDNMDCACSVAAWRLEQAGRLHEAPRCTSDGSFEDLQCAAGVCWCAETRTGKPKGRVVPDAAMKTLRCYNDDSVGMSYRRSCDSVLEAVADLERILKAHGSDRVRLPEVACDLDGGFAPVQTRQDGTVTFCAWKDKTSLYNYFQDTAAAADMNCKCARDKKYFANEDLPCLPNGNYNPRRSRDACYDEDGFYSYTLDNSEDKCLNEKESSRVLTLNLE